jgi:hypothetical protein
MQVQGMPKEIEKRHTNRASQFLWNEKKYHPVNLETTQAPIEDGGRNILDIKSRNDTINLMWLKRYTNLKPSHPLWTKVADALLSLANPTPTTRAITPRNTSFSNGKDPKQVPDGYQRSSKPSVRDR